MSVEFVADPMQGAFELTPELKAEIWAAAEQDSEALAERVYELMVVGAEIGWAAANSWSPECRSDCSTHNLPAYLPGLCDCKDD